MPDTSSDSRDALYRRPLRRILLVDDDAILLRALKRALEPLGAEMVECTTVVDGLDALRQGFDLIIVDVRLPDGTGLSLVEEAGRMQPTPLIVTLSGQASAGEAFRLAQAGALGYLQKPVSLHELLDTIERIRRSPPDFRPLLAAQVGNSDFKSIQADVRRTVLGQALGLAEGNRATAARILSVTRQAVQHMVRSGKKSADADAVDSESDAD